MIGVHRWVHKRNPESGASYLECERCQKELECERCQKEKDTVTLTDFSGD
jgi:hypothetical protein